MRTRADAPLFVCRFAPAAQRATERGRESAHLWQVQQSLWPRAQLRRGSHSHGPAGAATGMIAHLGDLDQFVKREVIEPFDHTYLNKDVPAFRERVPTTENLCIEIFDRLKAFPGARLVRIRLEETGRNSFEYAGDSNF